MDEHPLSIEKGRLSSAVVGVTGGLLLLFVLGFLYRLAVALGL